MQEASPSLEKKRSTEEGRRHVGIYIACKSLMKVHQLIKHSGPEGLPLK